MKNIHGLLLVGCSAVALAGCGADDIASPGTGGNVTINNTTNNPAPTPTPTPTPTGGAITPASGCPTIADPQGLTDDGTITGPTGTYRVCSLPNKINESIKLRAEEPAVSSGKSRSSRTATQCISTHECQSNDP